ncbi:MAG: DUF29 domain-containing protein [Symploca sp. SIO2G7]|nr:DUF29 domain-containing protein [Symploca sp. SIO2G7]
MTAELTRASQSLYEQDYNLWLEKTIQQLQVRRFTELDLPNLIEELEGMSRREKRAIYSNLKIILMHLLKYRYQPAKRSNSWRSTIREHRQRLKRAFQDSPSLQSYCQEIFPECYQDARELAADETGLVQEAFPTESPFSIEDTLAGEYLPE